MFGEFAHQTKKSADCAANCDHSYLIKAQYFVEKYYSDYSLEGEEVIVTKMNRFYQRIDIRRTEKNYISYEGIVFAGVSFRDQNGLAVKITRKRYKKL